MTEPTEETTLAQSERHWKPLGKPWLVVRVASTALLEVALCLGTAIQNQAQPLEQGRTPAGPQPVFEVASLKLSAAPGRRKRDVSHGALTILNESLLNIILWAYDIDRFQVSGPDWIRGMNYDIFAKGGAQAPEEQVRLMLQALLAERLKLTIHRETKPLYVVVMTAGKKGPRLPAPGVEGPLEVKPGKGRLVFVRARMADLAALLSASGTKTVDRTGIKGCFDFTLDYARYLDPAADAESSTFTFLAALSNAAEAQLGLKFREGKVPVEILVIDRVEKVPTAN